MRILVIGKGAREHALAWKITKSKKVEEIFVAPGNDGIEEYAHLIDITKTKDIINLVRNYRIDLTIVGPEQPLADGIVDDFYRYNLKVIGPTKSAAKIETSKIYAKNFMTKYSIPTADFEVFDDIVQALKFIRNQPYPLVIKADGLAGGKGVSIINNYTSGEIFLNKLMHQNVFGEAGKKVVIEKLLNGNEASVFAFTDGEDFVSTIISRDYKPLNDNDKGPNTGGMGAYAPVHYSKEVKRKIDEMILSPTIKGLKEEGNPFSGILYAGLIIENNEPKVLEFNCRLGYPETEAILPLLNNDIIDIFQAINNNSIKDIELDWKDMYSVTVVLASGGYPLKYEIGKEIKGIKDIIKDDNNIIFFSGVERNNDKFFTNGGRVLAITSIANTSEKAIKNAYSNINKITFDNMHYRKDIAKEL